MHPRPGPSDSTPGVPPMARRRMCGFTLIELLAVAVIIMVLAGFVIKITGYVNKKTNSSRAYADFAALNLALDNYKLNFGVYPSSTNLRTNGQYGSFYISNNLLLYAALTSTPQLSNSFPKSLRLTNAYNAWVPCGCANIYTGVTLAATFILDPWDRPYNYFCTYPPSTSQSNPATYDLWSFGPDKQMETLDDICSWRRR